MGNKNMKNLATEIMIEFNRLKPSQMRGKLLGYKLLYWPIGIKERNQTVIIEPVDPRNYITTNTKKARVRIENLTPFYTYQFEVVAFNAMGDGPNSKKGTFRTLEGKSDSVENLEMIRNEIDQIEISWEAPKKPYGEVQGYLLSLQPIQSVEDNQSNSNCQPGSNPIETSVESEIFNQKWQNLSPGCSYRITVACINGAGKGKSAGAVYKTLTKNEIRPNPVEKMEIILQSQDDEFGDLDKNKKKTNQKNKIPEVYLRFYENTLNKPRAKIDSVQIRYVEVENQDTVITEDLLKIGSKFQLNNLVKDNSNSNYYQIGPIKEFQIGKKYKYKIRAYAGFGGVSSDSSAVYALIGQENLISRSMTLISNFVMKTWTE